MLDYKNKWHNCNQTGEGILDNRDDGGRIVFEKEQTHKSLPQCRSRSIPVTVIQKGEMFFCVIKSAELTNFLYTYLRGFHNACKG
jgi:hypothetical protein